LNKTLLILGGRHTGLLLDDHSIRLFVDDRSSKTTKILTDVKFNVKSLALCYRQTGLLLDDHSIILFGADGYGQTTNYP